MNKFILGSLLILILFLGIFFIQIGGISETLTDAKYIEAGLNLANSLPSAPPSSYAKIVIIINNNGESSDGLEKILEIEETLTFAVDPFTPDSVKFANTAYLADHDIILNIPYTDETASMDRDKTFSYLDSAFDKIPMAVGVNTQIGTEHMMSYLSLKNKVLLKKDFLLDNPDNPSASDVKKQIKNAAKYAQEHGLAIAEGSIGNGWGPVTAQAISEMLPWLAENNVHIVGATEAFSK